MLSAQDHAARADSPSRADRPPLRRQFLLPPGPDAGRRARDRVGAPCSSLTTGSSASTPSAPHTAPARRPFSQDAAELLSYFKPPVVSFHFGLPSPELLQRVRSWGAKVLSSATTVDEARWLEANGADVIIAQGYEAGGHRGTFLGGNVSRADGHVRPAPADRECGTRAGRGGRRNRGCSNGLIGVLARRRPECRPAPPICCARKRRRVACIARALKEERASRTQLTNLFSGGVARGIPNRLMRELGPINPAAPAFPLASGALAPLRAAAERARQRRFLAAVGRSEHHAMHGIAGGADHPRPRRRDSPRRTS